MATKKTSLSFGTINDHIRSDYQLWASCNNVFCLHRTRIDLQALKSRLGGDHSILHKDLAPRLKCSRCGGKEIQLTVIPYGDNGPSAGSMWLKSFDNCEDTEKQRS